MQALSNIFKKGPTVSETEKRRTFSENSENSDASRAIEQTLLTTAVEDHEIDPLAEELLQGQDHVHYKTLNWWHGGILMIAECISLGILSLPHAMARLGLVPYVLI